MDGVVGLGWRKTADDIKDEMPDSDWEILRIVYIEHQWELKLNKYLIGKEFLSFDTEYHTCIPVMRNNS
jgi:hypothetical protein